MLNKQDPAGLYGTAPGGEDPIAIPLLGVRVHAKAHDFIAEVQVIQSYQNNHATSPLMECVYHFPLDDQAAVCGFEAEYPDGTIVKGKIQDKEKAAAQYQEAMVQGKQVNLLAQVRPDVFTIKVGNLPPGGHVKITLTYVTTLQAREDAMALILPTSLAPRYTPSASQVSPAEVAALKKNTVGLEPPMGLDITASFTCKSPIRSLQTPTHEYHEKGHTQVEGTTGTFHLRDVPFDHDLVVLCHEEQAHQPRVSVEVGPDGTRMVGIVSIFPKLEFRDRPREFIFLIDRSGSMGSRNQMEQAKDALLLFLRALPMGSTFNVVGFGSSFQSVFDAAKPYNDQTLQYASDAVASMQANLGGTEIVAPLRDIFARPLDYGELAREVFVLTDGQVSNNTAVFDLIRQNCAQDSPSRLFCVGVGARVSRHLCSGMARAGRGTVRFVEEGGEVLQTKLMGQLKQALQPRLDNVTVRWDTPVPLPKAAEVVETSVLPTLEEDTVSPVKTLLGYRSPNADDVLLNTGNVHPPSLGTSPRVCPSLGQTVFNQERLLSYAIFAPGSEKPTSVTISCVTEDGLLETSLPIRQEDVFEGLVAHKLAAREAIQEYEESKQHQGQHRNVLSREEALQMALSNSLVSQLTSFVAVSENPSHGVPPVDLLLPPPVQPYEARLPRNCCRSRRQRGVLKKCKKESKRRGSTGVSQSMGLEASMAWDLGGALGLPVQLQQQVSKPASLVWEDDEERATQEPLLRSQARGGHRRTKSAARGHEASDVTSVASAAMRAPTAMADHASPFSSLASSQKLGLQQQSDQHPSAFNLCVLQKADGSFALTPHLLAMVGLSEPIKLASLRASLEPLSDAVLATLLAVAAWRVLFSHQRSIWELNEAKSLSFLQLRTSGSEADVQTRLALVESYLAMPRP